MFRQITHALQHAHWFSYWIFAEYAHGTFLRAQQSEQMFEQCRLAGAVGTDQTIYASGNNRKIDVIQRVAIAVTPVQSAHFDYWSNHVHSSPLAFLMELLFSKASRLWISLNRSSDL